MKRTSDHEQQNRTAARLLLAAPVGSLAWLWVRAWEQRHGNQQQATPGDGEQLALAFEQGTEGQ
jgi:hypothetical protein